MFKMEDDIKKFENGRRLQSFWKEKMKMKFFYYTPFSSRYAIHGGEFQIWPKIAQNEKKYDFETFHAVHSNRNNKIWTLKTNTLMVLTLL